MSKLLPRCYNCLHSGQRFKIGKVTHQHCEHPKYTQEQYDKGEISAWDTVMKFSDTCVDHEFKNQTTPTTKDPVDGYGGC